MMGSTPAYAEPFDLGDALAVFWGFFCDWMYANAGTAASVISAAAAILAIWVAVRIQTENTSPSVIAYIEKDSNAAFKLILKNIGQGAAHNVKIENFDMGMVQVGQSSFAKLTKSSFVVNGVPMLAPGSIRETILAETTYAKRNLSGRSNAVTVSWSLKSSGRKRESNDCVLEYDSFFDSLNADPLDVRAVRALEGIQKKLE